MPKAAEDALKKEAKKKFPGDKKQQDKYVYGAMRHKLGWKPKKQRQVMLVKRRNEKTDQLEWALESISKPGKILQWFGVSKPSEETVAKVEKRIQWFKNKGK